MISVISATMWRFEPFLDFVESICDVSAVGEVIIVNNDVSRTPTHKALRNPKVKLLNCEKNILVNPAWNLGATMSQFDKLCIMNDDVIFDLKLFYKIEDWLTPAVGVAGICPGQPDTNQPPFSNGAIDFVKWNNHSLYGFGGLFFVHKTNWENIPGELQVTHGDNWIFDRNILVTKRPNYLITNIFYYHAEAATHRAANIPSKNFYDIEAPIYQRIFLEMKTHENEPPMNNEAQQLLEAEFQDACQEFARGNLALGFHGRSDIYQHVPRLRALAEQCQHVTELGVRTGQSTRAFLPTNVVLRSYDIILAAEVEHLFGIARSAGKDMSYQYGNSMEMDLEPTDLLFIDTEHLYTQLTVELARHHSKARKYIVFHDTHMPCMPETIPAIFEFLAAHPEWRVKAHYTDSHGLTVLERIAG